jgi:bifunctional non-homologous end joining protein LigD
MGLGDYIKKRRFAETPEPKGAPKKSYNKKLAFVVQEHHATALHYDFRLELDGVLKSWAIPKGPSLDPHEHHLAVQTEDHPYEYRTFEGVIPEGNYGAGNVIIWDQGWYEARADTDDDQAELRHGLKKGHITFVLHGEKLKGEFALIKFHGEHDTKKNWLLVKKGDEYATSRDITKASRSVISHKNVDDLGAHNKLPDLSKYPKITKPWTVTPMLCTLIEAPFSKAGWLFEIKWDGYRAIGTRDGHDVSLYSRNHIDFMAKYPPVVEALRDFKHDVIVDGEIVVVDGNGKPHFEWLQEWHKNPQGSLLYYIFDLLWVDGRDLRSAPLLERRHLLQTLMPRNDVLGFSDDVQMAGEKLFVHMQRRGLEGMVAKKADSPYREGERGGDWLKVKTHMRQEVVIGGYTEPRGGRQYLGSLMVGVYDRGEFVYVGHSGGGIPDEQRKTLQAKLAQLERKSSPFNTEPKPNAPVHWVKPELVCEMSFSEWTKEGYMRHPAFEGMREDKDPKAVHRERPKPAKPAATKAEHAIGPEFTHLDKVFFPKHKYTKGDLIHYYTSIADYILPYLKDRPCSMNRMPDGIAGPSFFQKNNEHLPPWVSHADIFSESNNADLRWIVGGDISSLLYMVQLGSIEINPWNSRVKRLKHPDWIVIDLDPEGVSFGKVVEVAQTVHEVCTEWKIPHYPKTSGKTGLHIYIPMGAKYTSEQAKNLAHIIVLEVNKRQPNITSVERMPEKRHHKIYLDFLQNREGQTLAAPYSVRPTPDATVAMPLHWEEVNQGLKPTDFTIKNAPARLKKLGDIWKPVLGPGIDLAKTLEIIERAQS